MPASLGGELRPRLDRLTLAMVDALYLAAPFLTDVEPALLEERTRAHLPPDRWSDGERRELTAAMATIRAAAPRSPARAKAAGMLRIGTPGDYAPFSLWADGRLGGVDVELATGLAAALGLRPVFIQTSWKTLLADLAADRFDIAVGGISITPGRAAVAAFSRPTAHGGKTAVGRCRERERLGSLTAIDQAGVRVIENPGGTNERFARQTLRHAELRIHPDNRTIFEELRAGRADVMFTDDTEIALVTHRMAELCRLLDEIYEPADKAFLLPAGGDWVAAVDDWLASELEHGTPSRLLDAYLKR
jgi:cyclohexadienyl dehydratase